MEATVGIRDSDLDPWTRSTLRRHREASLADLAQARAASTEFYQLLAPILEAHDILVVPTVRRVDIPAESNLEDHLELAGEPEFIHDPNMAWLLAYPFNLVNRLPVMSVPIGFAGNGVPVGMQLVARSYDDLRVFEAALCFEELRGAWFHAGGPRPPNSFPTAGEHR